MSAAKMASAILRLRWWTWRGVIIALGNREHVPDFSEAAGRADRAESVAVVGPPWLFTSKGGLSEAGACQSGLYGR